MLERICCNKALMIVAISLPRYLAPEVLCGGPVQVADELGICTQPTTGPKADTWAVGIILLELFLVSAIGT